MKYKRKSIVIDAIEVKTISGARDTSEIPPWVAGVIMGGMIKPCEQHLFIIKTLEGDVYADSGDYIVRGTRGELYLCEPDIFEQIYELVED